MQFNQKVHKDFPATKKCKIMADTFLRIVLAIPATPQKGDLDWQHFRLSLLPVSEHLLSKMFDTCAVEFLFLEIKQPSC